MKPPHYIRCLVNRSAIACGPLTKKFAEPWSNEHTS